MSGDDALPRPTAGRDDGGKWLVLAGVTIPSVLGCIDFTIVNTALPVIQAYFGASVAALQWIVTAFLLALSTLMVIAGRLADRHGRRRLLFAGLALFGGASVWAGMATSLDALIAARVLQGAACAILYTAPASIVADAFPETERGRAIGLLFGANGVGLAIGPAIGGVLADTFGWRSIFLVNVPLVLIAFALCLASVRESRGARAAIDWAGGTMLLIGTPLLVVGLLRGGAWGWGSPLTVGTLLGAVAAFAAFVVVERHAPDPIVPLPLLAQPAFAGNLVATAGLGAFYCVAFFLLPILLQSVLRLAPGPAGLLLLVATAGVAILSPVAGRLVDRRGVRPLLVAGFVAFAASATILATAGTAGGLEAIVAALALLGAGWAFILGPSTVGAISALPADASGLAVGIASTVHNLGGAIGLVLGTLAFETAGGVADFAAGFRASSLLLLLLSLLAAAAILRLLPRRTS